MLHFARLIIAALVVFATAAANAASSHYGLTISTAATYNVSFKNGVFSATGDKAVLNVNDLESALANGDILVTTGNGAGGDEQGDLHIEATLGWQSAQSLTLNAYHSIFVDQTVSDKGSGGLSIVTNAGGSEGIFSIGVDPHAIKTSGRITIKYLSDALSINGTAYSLVGSVQGLAAAIAANPSGSYALAANYDASGDGTYSSPPIATMFPGNFDGLGNVISNLAIQDDGTGYDGLFEYIERPATVSHLNLSGLDITATSGAWIGGLASENDGGALFEDSASGTMRVTLQSNGSIGGLIGYSTGTIDRSSAAVAIAFEGQGNAGGLVGWDTGTNPDHPGTITNSYATGTISARHGTIMGGLVGQLWSAAVATSYATGNISCTGSCHAGGLAGKVAANRSSDGMAASVENSYATGDITHRNNDGTLGGLIGVIEHASRHSSGISMADTYSTGAPSGGSLVGGFVGEDSTRRPTLTGCYWDTDTSGITSLSQGAGSPPDDIGITGQSTNQLQSGLPEGFDPAIWTESTGINGGLPYLIYNQPQQ